MLFTGLSRRPCLADLVLVRLLEIPVSARLVSPPTTALGPMGRPRSSLPKLSTRSPAAVCLACCSLKCPGQDQGCSLALGLLACHLAWASFEHNTQSHHHYKGTSPAAGNRPPAHQGSLCKMTLEPGNIPPRLSESPGQPSP